MVRGAGSALYDNLRVTVFEGTDFAAEAVKVRGPPTIDGKLDDWDGSCPIPLIGRNQLHVLDKNYAWTPQNLSGVAYLRWDEKNLYVAVEVLDDVHHPAGDGETVIDGDSVILAFDPTHRVAGRGQPVAGLLRFVAEAGRRQRHAHAVAAGPAQRRTARGTPGARLVGLRVRRPAGQRAGASTSCRIPWSELGISPAFGAKFGFAIQLNDNDGQGPAARMNWGGGLSPAWHPASFGVITLVE